MNRSQHRPPIVRATRVLQHVAAALVTLGVVEVVGVIGTRVGAPDPATGSATRVFPDEPRPVVAPSPVPVAPVPPVVVEPEPVVAPRPVVTPQQPVVVIVEDPAPVEAAPEPEPVLVAPQEPAEPPKPARTAQRRQQRDTRAQTAREDRETTNTQQPGQLCAVVCVQLDEQGDGEP